MKSAACSGSGERSVRLRLGRDRGALRIALLALLLAAIGLNALLGLNVAGRRPEIGVRLALGASATRILRLVFAQSLLLVLPGLVLGCALGVITARFLAEHLFRVEPTDVPAWLLSVLGVALVAMIASLLPARRAARVPPRAALDPHA